MPDNLEKLLRENHEKRLTAEKRDAERAAEIVKAEGAIFLAFVERRLAGFKTFEVDRSVVEEWRFLKGRKYVSSEAHCGSRPQSIHSISKLLRSRH